MTIKEIKTVGVIGAGQMGSGIAQVSAMAGYQTILWDSSEGALNRAVSAIKSQLERLQEKGRCSKEEVAGTIARLQSGTEIGSLKDSDMVIEAVVERFEVKAELFVKLDSVLEASSLIVSNTSSISITRLAAMTKRPDKVMGVHFMNPVPVMKLVELIRGLQTSDESYQALINYCAKIGKTTVLATDTPGFIVNRILCPMINEAIFLLQEGVKPEDIDNAMKLGTNQPMGPITLADFVGLDTLLFILQVLHRELGEDKYRPCPLLIKYVEAGWYGKKVGRGFYRYENAG